MLWRDYSNDIRRMRRATLLQPRRTSAQVPTCNVDLVANARTRKAVPAGIISAQQHR